MKTEILLPTDENIKKAGEALARGELVAFPTETVYGLGADALNAVACCEIYKVKGRAGDNPLIVHVAFPEDAEKYAYTTPEYYLLAESLMPGPLTVILPKRDCISDAVTGGLDSVAIRCPRDPIAHKLIVAAGRPIAAPSANRSGAPSPTNAKDVFADMDTRIPYIIDGGESECGVESTVIKPMGDACIILRPGSVTVGMLKKIFREVTVSSAVKNPESAGEKPLSPGMKYKHYSPKAELFLLDGDRASTLKYVNEHKTHKTAVICCDGEESQYPGCIILNCGSADDYREYEHRLFSLLRRADDYGADVIYAELPPDGDEYLAIYNRIIRAAGSKIIKL